MVGERVFSSAANHLPSSGKVLCLNYEVCSGHSRAMRCVSQNEVSLLVWLHKTIVCRHRPLVGIITDEASAKLSPTHVWILDLRSRMQMCRWSAKRFDGWVWRIKIVITSYRKFVGSYRVDWRPERNDTFDVISRLNEMVRYRFVLGKMWELASVRS